MLLLGAIKGVLVGMVLSFIDVLMRAAAPQRTFLGTLPGKAGFFPIDRVSGAQALPHIVLYRFSGSLFSPTSAASRRTSRARCSLIRRPSSSTAAPS